MAMHAELDLLEQDRDQTACLPSQGTGRNTDVGGEMSQVGVGDGIVELQKIYDLL